MFEHNLFFILFYPTRCIPHRVFVAYLRLVASFVAERLDILHLDTGAMYRAMALFLLRSGIRGEETERISVECQKADILIACAGSAKMIGSGFTHPEQIVIDVGINTVDGKLCGDADYDAVSEIAAAVTPVPGGVGTVTTSVLLKHTVTAAALQGRRPWNKLPD